MTFCAFIVKDFGVNAENKCMEDVAAPLCKIVEEESKELQNE